MSEGDMPVALAALSWGRQVGQASSLHAGG